MVKHAFFSSYAEPTPNPDPVHGRQRDPRATGGAKSAPGMMWIRKAEIRAYGAGFSENACGYDARWAIT